MLELQTVCLASATGQGADNNRYQQLRNGLVGEERIRGRLPVFVRTCRDLGAFWSFIQPKFPTYAERRTYIRGEFQGLLDDLEHDMPAADCEVTDILRRVTTDTVREVWERAQARRAEDPDGAITLARTLLETICKHRQPIFGDVNWGDPDYDFMYIFVDFGWTFVEAVARRYGHPDQERLRTKLRYFALVDQLDTILHGAGLASDGQERDAWRRLGELVRAPAGV